MRWRWPWSHRHEPREALPNSGAAARKAEEEAKLRAQKKIWPEVLQARDELARLAEQAMRGQR